MDNEKPLAHTVESLILDLLKFIKHNTYLDGDCESIEVEPLRAYLHKQQIKAVPTVWNQMLYDIWRAESATRETELSFEAWKKTLDD